MKIAVISDIHGNLEALKKAVQDIEKRKVNTIVCAGDLVGYGPYQNEVIEYINSKNILLIYGNYDAAVANNDVNFIKDTPFNKNFALPWSVNTVSEENKNWLKKLPESITLAINGKVIKVVHGSPLKVNQYLFEDAEDTKEIMEKFQGDVLVCAHTHLPFVKYFGDKMMINDGSVGKPKNATHNITYALINIDYEISAEIIELKHDNSALIEELKRLDVHKEVIDSFVEGK
ncbi:metallophosphoesterase family protein [Clostridium grantii]|uniref:Phosphoesterase n=1 Tax=Clostridium grantii DSM 8605 TaxID=1121316 RepID=A0A1M5QFG3_9CLOT|nr:YfcE family phosphodiesterase [Clostridium grantii]SHH12581.1 phosphoesterase, MJ0936 family [Clostridium grantii DSM 8605]